jgi:hypothetical protein
MEKYYRVSDVNEILNKLAKEPAYYHEGEGFYNGVCAVEGELMCLELVELEELKVGKWLFTKYAGGEYYKCSCCGKDYPLPPTWTTYDIKKYLRYCSCCGAKMLEE